MYKLLNGILFVLLLIICYIHHMKFFHLSDDDTLLVNEELLKGLDEELDAFLKDLLEK